jgi:hypothetical protein
LLPDPRRLVAPEIMGRIYEALLDRVEASGYRLFDEAINLPRATKASIAVRVWVASRWAKRGVGA